MDLLEGFEYVDLDEGTPFMHVFEHGITFSKGVCERLGSPQKVIFRLDEPRCKCALQGVDVDDPRGVDFFSFQDMTREKITWKDRHLAQRIADMGGWDLCAHSYVAMGYELPDEDAIMFDVRTAKPDEGKRECAPDVAADDKEQETDK